VTHEMPSVAAFGISASLLGLWFGCGAWPKDMWSRVRRSRRRVSLGFCARLLIHTSISIELSFPFLKHPGSECALPVSFYRYPH
jgi:hypothetical protein